MDRPTPVDLVGFFADRNPSGTQLSWQTASEVNIAGFELRAHDSLLATFVSDNDLRAKSRYGANYSYRDALSSSERYDLYEITNDGVEELLASRWVQTAGDGALAITVADGEVHVLAQSIERLRLYDLLGREVASSSSPLLQLPTSLTTGVYLLRIERSDSDPVAEKIMLRNK
jgi:hypothetical protein